MTKLQIDKEISKFEPNATNEDRRAYRAILTAPVIGPFDGKKDAYKRLADYWNDNSSEFKKMIQRLIDNRVFNVNHEKKWLCGEIYKDGVGLALGACIAQGMIERVSR